MVFRPTGTSQAIRKSFQDDEITAMPISIPDSDRPIMTMLGHFG